MTATYLARIRPTSKYADQDTGEPFAVSLNPDDTAGYIWKGGPGGQYRHSDLQLLTRDWMGELTPIPLFANGEERAYLQIICDDYQQAANAGRIEPAHFTAWAEDIIQQLRTIAATATETYKDDD